MERYRNVYVQKTIWITFLLRLDHLPGERSTDQQSTLQTVNVLEKNKKKKIIDVLKKYARAQPYLNCSP